MTKSDWLIIAAVVAADVIAVYFVGPVVGYGKMVVP